MTGSIKEILEDRGAEYGPYDQECERVAKMWSAILSVEIKPRMVPLCMIAVKMARETHKHKPDNLLDIQGYAKKAGELSGIPG
jgi:hypothetical protein